MWRSCHTPAFEEWWRNLDPAARDAISRSVLLLEVRGPVLGRPHVDTLKGSRVRHLKELRVQHRGRPLRVIFAFDPYRTAVLLTGGDKTGDKRFYDRLIPIAERAYELHLKEVGGNREGSDADA